ncbi:MAG: methylmalonyl Co-A mutase-associated GTPase MeaB [Geminicoccaceae bacterium]|nr:methylmalonyl Co-A mutase-associated GTPase MeaB [Geminicoccaceae bacterium]
MLSADGLVEAILNGDRAALARAITLVESRRTEHQDRAQNLLERLLPCTGKSRRIGITGVPGAGKSTFIDAFGTMLTSRGHRVAVLAVDPSSSRTGGSILGDKTRMERLSIDERSFIRPSPTSGALGGVARMTRETMLLCEASGFDIILVETVGVGQSETVVADMVDFFLVLMLPGAGDELQGIKKGVLELADMIAVNKCDGDGRLRAEQAATHYRRALHIIEPKGPNWTVPVLTVSAIAETGLDKVWEEISRHHELLTASGEMEALRRDQRLRWMWSMLEGRLLDRLRRDRDTREAIERAEGAVRAGELLPTRAVNEILDRLM